MFHPTMHKGSQILFAPLIRLAEYIGRVNPVLLVKVRYFLRFHKKVNLKNPRDLNEKILYAKLYTDTTIWANLFDKYKVRDYVKSCGLNDILTKFYGCWDNVDDIDYNKLPDSFILKANNGDGKSQFVIVRDKMSFLKNDVEHATKKMQSWLERKNVGCLAGEPYLRFVKPLIVAEELLPSEDGRTSLIDYKIWCINGRVEYIWTCTERDQDGTDVMTYDRNWGAHPEYSVFDSRYRRGELMEKPSNLEGLIEVAELLSKPFPVVRVDLYHINGKIYFGEMTFTSLGGMMNFYTQDFLNLLGDKIDINSFPIK